MEFKYCRRCGEALEHVEQHIYKCKNNHTIFANSAPASAAVILNDKNEILVGVRSIAPHKDSLDLPGGFIDGDEIIENSLRRELYEEVGLQEKDYGELIYLLSEIDMYEYGGENILVLSSMFTTRLNKDVNLQANDDLGDTFFVALKDINLDDFPFNSAKSAIKRLMDIGAENI